MGTSTYATTRQRASAAAAAGWLDAMHSLWQRWRQRSSMRAELRAMDARTLADIGLDPESARQETRKFFWQC